MGPRFYDQIINLKQNYGLKRRVAFDLEFIHVEINVEMKGFRILVVSHQGGLS